MLFRSFQRGSNDDGSLIYMNENQKTVATNYNDLPVKTYDFQAPLGEFGQTYPHYYMLRKLHLFMHAAHDSKGKEFPVVILYGIEDFEDGNEEDRRTLYVAVTRARKVLFLLERYPGKSSFLREMSECISINRRERYEN